MREILAVAMKDFRRHRRDWLAFTMWLGIPLVVGSIMILATGGATGPRPQAVLLVADEDDSFLSHALLSMMSQDSASDMIHVVRVAQADGRRRIDQGDGAALLVIPHEFSKNVLRDRPSKLLLVKNPAQRILPDIIEEMVRVAVDGAFYAQRIAGPQLQTMIDRQEKAKSPPSNIEIAAMAISVNQIADRLRKSAFPPVIELQTRLLPSDAGKPDPHTPLAFLFLPGIAVMGLLFAAQGLSGEIWLEREAGVLKRVVTSPLGIHRFIAGKMLAAAGVITGIVVIVLTAGVFYLGLPGTRLPLAVFWSVAIGLMLMAMLLLVQVVATSRRGASLLSYAVVMPLMMLGGSMFPLEMMPRWMAAIGRYTPNGFGIAELKVILLGNATIAGFAMNLAVMLGITVVFLWLATLRLDRFARS